MLEEGSITIDKLGHPALLYNSYSTLSLIVCNGGAFEYNNNKNGKGLKEIGAIQSRVIVFIISALPAASCYSDSSSIFLVAVSSV